MKRGRDPQKLLNIREWYLSRRDPVLDWHDEVTDEVTSTQTDLEKFGALVPSASAHETRSTRKVPSYKQGLRAPGRRPATRASCGNITRTGVCPRHDVQIKEHDWCAKYDCGKCHGTWARLLAAKAADRVWQGQDKFDNRWAPRHWTFSPPPADSARLFSYGDEMITRARRELDIAFQRTGLDRDRSGWFLIPHPWRITPEGKEAYSHYRDMAIGLNEKVLSKWNWIRSKDLWDSCTDESFHFHAMWIGTFPDSAKFNRETGWIAKCIRRVRDREDLQKVIEYTLTHTGRIGGQHAATYGGLLSYNKLLKVWEGTYMEETYCVNNLDCERQLLVGDSNGVVWSRRPFLHPVKLRQYEFARKPG